MLTEIIDKGIKGFTEVKNIFFPPTDGLDMDEYKARIDRMPLSEYLMAAAYDEEIGCYQCRDNTVGAILECFPQQMAGEATIKTLTDIFSSVNLMPYTNIQIMLWADDYLEPFVARFLALRQDSEGNYINHKSKVWCESKADFLLSHKRKPAVNITPVPFRDFRLFVSLKLPIGIEEYNARVAEIDMIFKNIKAAFETNKMCPIRVTPDKYIRIMSLLLNPNHDRAIKTYYDHNEYIYKQIIEADTEFAVGKRHIKYDGVYGKALTVKQFPDQVSIVDTMLFIGDLFNNEQQIGCPFVLTLNVTVQPDSVKTKFLQKSEFLYKQKAASALSIKLLKKQEEAAWMMDKLEDGSRLLKAYVTWWLYHDDATVISKAAQVLKSMLNMRGYKLQEEIKAMNLALFMSALPLNLNTDIASNLIKRNRTMFDFNAAHLAPVQADWKGTGTPVLVYTSRRGQSIFFNYFDGSEAFNTCVAARTGGGKSFLICDAAIAYYTMPSTSNIWIIDIGGSYKRICENFDGVYLDFSEDSDIVVNPFSDCDNLSEDMDLLKSLISKMAKPTERVTDTETSVIEEAIKTAYLKYEKKTNIDTIIEVLREMSDGKDPIKGKACDTIATNLFRWGSGGVFGKFFNGENNVNLDHRFIVLELKNLGRREDLRNVMLMVLFYHIQRVVYEDDDRSKRKLLIFDEAWQFFRDDAVSLFIERAYRTFRKHGASCCTVTQGINDYYANNSTKQMLLQSSYRLLLPQKPESINMLKKEAHLVYGDLEYEMLDSLRTAKGYYSEVFFDTPCGRGIGRHIVPREHYWMYTTDAEETTKIDQLIKEYGIEGGYKKCVELYG